MALYNVESPGGYMNTGLSIPGADILGFNNGYSSDEYRLSFKTDIRRYCEIEKTYRLMTEIFEIRRYQSILTRDHHSR